MQAGQLSACCDIRLPNAGLTPKFTSNSNLQAACGCLFTLNGLCNVVLYVSTRHVYRGEKASAGKSSDEGKVRFSIIRKAPIDK